MSELVNHPAHYNQGKIEVIDAIEDWKLGFHEGNVVKYVARSAYKGTRETDLRKASWYLNRLLTILGDKTIANRQPEAKNSVDSPETPGIYISTEPVSTFDTLRNAIDVLKSQLKGSEDRCKLLLDAYNKWVDRAKQAEKERDALCEEKDKWMAICKDAQDKRSETLDKLQEKNEKLQALKEALQPFAGILSLVPESIGDDSCLPHWIKGNAIDLNLGDLRKVVILIKDI